MRHLQAQRKAAEAKEAAKRRKDKERERLAAAAAAAERKAEKKAAKKEGEGRSPIGSCSFNMHALLALTVKSAAPAAVMTAAD